MRAINESSRRISEIIGAIEEIAFQTNLLALNAAVEAARAGEHGRGFAVVASEVRNLAVRSAQAARETKSLIEESVRNVTDGSRLVDESGRTLDEIVTSVKRATDLVGEISASSREQASGVDDVSQAIVAMDVVTQQNASLVQGSVVSARALSDQAEALSELVAFFDLGPAARRRVAPVVTGGGLRHAAGR
jgi:methyl-accepting chemotaxis protein